MKNNKSGNTHTDKNPNISDKIFSPFKRFFCNKSESKHIRNMRIKRHLFKLGNRYTPRYLVFATDITIVAISSFILDLMRGTLLRMPSYYLMDGFMERFVSTIVVFAASFFIFRTYRGIVRYSGTRDALRLFVSVITAIFTLYIVSEITRHVTGEPIFDSFLMQVILGMLVMLNLAVMRFGIKYLYNEKIAENIKDRTRVMVLGTNPESAILAKKLRDEEQSKYVPVALLQIDNDKSAAFEIDGIPMVKYDPEKVVEIFAKYRCDTMIFEQTHIKALKNGGIDPFLYANIKVMQFYENSIEHRKGDKSISVSSNIQNLQIEDLLERDEIKLDNTQIREYIEGKCVMVTGAAGSIGSEIVRQLSRLNARQIILFDNAETPMHNLYLETKKNGYKDKVVLFIGDIRNKIRLEEAFIKYSPQVVFHAAAYKHVPMMELHPGESVRTNVGGSKNLADMSLKYNVEKFVMISTDKAVNPTNVMGASKRLAEIYVQSLALKIKKENSSSTQFMTTRFGNVLGSNGSVVPLFKEQITEGGPITITDKRIVRYFMTIPEACELVLEAGCIGKGGEIFVFDMGHPVKIYEMAKRMIMLSGLKPYIDIDIVETGLRHGEKLYEEVLNDKESTTATIHEKIMVGKVREYDYNDVSPLIDNLLHIAEHNDSMQIVKKMKEIVPEYISQNSVFEQLDKK